MTTTINQKAKQSSSWAKAIAKPATEFPLTQLSPISGKIPENLKGSLYRNGPARLERGGMQVGHWFDGDGAILAVHFAEGQARATYLEIGDRTPNDSVNYPNESECSGN